MMIIRPKKSYQTFNYISSHQLLCQLVLFCALSLIMFVPSARCELKAINDGELKTITGQAGFTQLTLNNSTARLFLDIHIETFGTIDGLNAGYFDDGTINGLGWDIQWNNVKIGHSMNDPLVMDGMVFIADFDNLEAADPKLERFVFGTNRLQGSLSANMDSFSGMYNDALTGGGGSPVSLSDRSALGRTTFNFNSNGSMDKDMGLFFILNLTETNPGFHVVAGYDENTLKTMSQGPWWDSP